MKLSLPFAALALCLVLAISGCGGDDATSSETQESNPATTADGEGKAQPEAPPLESKPSKVVIGKYEAEGPFLAISGRKGNRKPVFHAAGERGPKKTLIRDLKVGSGPAARHGDEVSFYYAAAYHDSGKIQYYGWPPNSPATLKLGFGTFGRSWEKTIEGMRLGGIRQVIITASYLSNTPLDYVIVLKGLRPQSG
jgi:FKBP-type peptidyl-prolyl cis-trans isomerase